MHGAFCKQFGGGNGKGCGKFQNKIRAAFHSMARALVFSQDRRFAALSKISAHQTKNFITAASGSDFVQLITVTVMKRIVFAYYCTYLHFCLFNTIYCVLNTNFVLHIDCSLFVVHDLSTLITVALKEFLDFVNCIRLRFQSCVSIDVQSSGHFAVPKSLLNNFWIDAARQQYCRVSVSERVV